jgi:predicted nuclease of predicted toxin-antitoxin system
MKFLLDVCVSSRSLEAYLIGKGHDVLSAVAIDPKASDQQLLARALRDERVLLTEDKDFGELVFVCGSPHGPIVRLVELTVDGQVSGMAELLEHYAAELTGPAILTVTRGRIRIRR